MAKESKVLKASIFNQHRLSLDALGIIIQSDKIFRSVQEIFFTIEDERADHVVVHAKRRQRIIIRQVRSPDSPGFAVGFKTKLTTCLLVAATTSSLGKSFFQSEILSV